jgi:hypothetical protein
MKKFRELFVECGCGHMPVISLSKVMVNLETPGTRDEINRNIAAELSRDFSEPFGAWMKISKVLSMYNIYLPKLDYDDKRFGEKIVALQQFGDRWGMKVDGTNTPPHMPEAPNHYLYFVYGIDSSGFYKAFAAVTDEEELNNLVDRVDRISPQGDLDPRQK